jgi:hypothetical protein
MVDSFSDVVVIPMLQLVLLVLLLFLLKKRWLAMGAFLAIFVAVSAGLSESPLAAALSGAAVGGITLFVIVRFGLLALIFGWLFGYWANLLAAPPNASAWFAGRWVFLIAVTLCLVVYGFVISLGGRRIFHDSLLEERPVS